MEVWRSLNLTACLGPGTDPRFKLQEPAVIPHGGSLDTPLMTIKECMAALGCALLHTQGWKIPVISPWPALSWERDCLRNMGAVRPQSFCSKKVT